MVAVAQVAAIDVGSNSVLLLLADVGPSGVRVLEERCEVTRLGKGLAHGAPLDPDAANRTIEVLIDYGARARAVGARVLAVGTEALRRARDGESFLGRARAALGVGLAIISPEREASLALRAVAESFAEMGGPLVVLDIGGASTEVVLGGLGPRAGKVERFDSLPLGSVRLHERHIDHDPATPAEIAALQADVETVLAQASVRPPAAAPVVGVAATVTTLAAVEAGVVPYDGERVHGGWLLASEVTRQVDLYSRLPVSERQRIPGLDPRRAEVILAGALLLERLMSWLSVGSIRVSDRGVRWGLVHEFAAEIADVDPQSSTS